MPRTLPVLPLRETIPLPDTLIPLAVGQDRSVALVDDVLRGNRMLVMVASRHPEKEVPSPDELFEVGVVGAIARMIKVPDGTMRILVQGGQRVHIDSWVRETPYLVAEISELPDVMPAESAELEALTRNVQTTFSSIVESNPYLPEELQLAIANIDDPSALSHLIAGSLRLKAEEKQALLEEVDVALRLRRLVEILARELEVISIGSEIQNQVQSEIDKGQREFVLRQQLDAIRRELGEFDESAAEANELREQLDAIALPEDVRRQVDRELKRLESLPPQAAEHSVIRTYLEWIASLPWDKTTEDNLDLSSRPLGARRGPLRHRAGQGPHHRVPRRAQAQARRARLDPVLRRPARAWARPRSGARSRGRWDASSSASAPAACAMRPRSAATGAPTSAPCPGRSSARCATRSPRTRCS